MKLSKRGRYALRALVYLSLNSDKEKMTLSKIAKENDISTKYLEQIFSNLKRSGIVKSVAGINGGYLLARPSTDISVEDVLNAVELCRDCRNGCTAHTHSFYKDKVEYDI